MKNVPKAATFAVVCGVVAFLLSFATGGDIGRAVTAGIIGFVVGAMLMIALRWRP